MCTRPAKLEVCEVLSRRQNVIDGKERDDGQNIVL